MKNLLLTGKPGIGKTTLIKRILDECTLRAGGFYTQEIRENNTRLGFKIIALSGQMGILAHVDSKSRHAVGKYRVNLADIETVAVKSIFEAFEQNELIVIDEIGKMELFSDKFKKAVLMALDSQKPVLGTITLAPSSFTNKIRESREVEIFWVTRNNRELIFKRILSELQSIRSTLQ